MSLPRLNFRSNRFRSPAYQKERQTQTAQILGTYRSGEMPQNRAAEALLWWGYGAHEIWFLLHE